MIVWDPAGISTKAPRPPSLQRRTANAPFTHQVAAGEQEAPVLRPSGREEGGGNASCVGLEKLGQIRTRQDHHFGGIPKTDRDAGAIRRERRRKGLMTLQSEVSDWIHILVGRIEPDEPVI
jgi:hypothetical protein